MNSPGRPGGPVVEWTPDRVRTIINETSIIGGAALADEVLEMAAAYIALRSRWNRTHNLIGPMAERDVRADLIDSFVLVSRIPTDIPLVDVGAGGGVPGALIAIARPDLDVWLVEPRAKRTAFLRTAMVQLGLSRVRVMRERWPIRLDTPVQAVSRAVVGPADWPTLAVSAGPHVVRVVRMLARERPPIGTSGFICSDSVEYSVDDTRWRRIEIWDRAAGA